VLGGPQRKSQIKGIAQGDVLAQNRGMAQVCGLVAEVAVAGTLSCSDSFGNTIPVRGLVS